MRADTVLVPTHLCVGNQQEWDALIPERSGVGWIPSRLHRSLTVTSRRNPSSTTRLLALRPVIDGGRVSSNIRLIGDETVEPYHLEDLLYVWSKGADVEGAVLLLEILPEVQKNA